MALASARKPARRRARLGLGQRLVPGLVQAGVLDRDHGLGGEEREQLAVLLADGPLARLGRRDDHAAQLPLVEQRLADGGTRPAPFEDDRLSEGGGAIVGHHDAGAALRRRPRPALRPA